MKQHEFDKWVKQSVSDYEETADKVEWNKAKVFDSLMSMQNAPEKRKWKLSYSAAAIILALISINIFQFLQLNSVNEKYSLIYSNMNQIEKVNSELETKLNNKTVEIKKYEDDLALMINKLENNKVAINELQTKISENVQQKEVEYITKIVHDTVYIENIITEELLTYNDIQNDHGNNIPNKEDQQYFNSYKPLVSNNIGKQRRFPIRIVFGSETSGSGNKLKKTNIRLSADL